jgi:TRAP-type C4-dicarboxylate transport system permease small subunit
MNPSFARVLKRLQRIGLRIEDGLLALLLTGMILLATLQILLRNLWDTGISWGDPSLRLMVLWITLLGAMVATREHHHIRIDILARLLPGRWKPIAQRITDLFAGVITGLLAWHAARFVWFEWQDGSTLFAAVPAWICELIIPFGFAVIALRFLARALSGRLPETGER